MRQWPLYILILPALIYIIIFCYQPMYGVIIAFKNYRVSKGILGSDWVGLKHFIRFLNYPNFWLILRNTAVISLYSLATFPLSLILALLLNELTSTRFRRVIQMVSYAPHFISTVVICSMLTLFLNRSQGLFNHIIAMLGGERIPFLEEAGYFASIYVWSGVWQSIGWGTIIYLAVLSGISPELVEAAKIDGANRYHIIRHINIPSIMPTIVILLILSCGNILSVGFEKIYLLQNSLNLDASQVISTYVYTLGLQGGQFSYSSAIGLFNTLINVMMLLLVNTIARRISNVCLW